MRWTSKSTRALAAELADQARQVSHEKVAQILRSMDYSLQGNRKTEEGNDHPDRDAQFRHINATVKAALAKGQPVVSVDTKKKELLGNYVNEGRQWRPGKTPLKVNGHDFPDPSVPRAYPYGIYDLGKNTGFVNIGIDHDTGAFAVASIRGWWRFEGKRLYPKAKALLITADGGGSNGYRLRIWKYELQRLADSLGLAITVRHFPPGTSKWNKVEHRLFSFISSNWRGEPLRDHETIVNLIAGTTTATGDTNFMDLSASIVLYNTNPNQLDRLYQCISASSVAVDLHFVDNSPMPCIDPAAYPGVKYYHTGKNLGYGAGHNIALRQVIDTGRFHFILNPDVYFDTDVLEKLANFLATNEDVGHAMPHIVNPDGSTQYLCKFLPNPMDLILRRFLSAPWAVLYRARNHFMEMRFTGYDKIIDVPFLSGCFMALRLEALRAVGMFEERYFIYTEDIDLTRRIHRRFRTVYWPLATIVHDHRRDSYKSSKMLITHILSAITYFNKWGWFFDADRRRINRKVLRLVQAGGEVRVSSQDL
jgi:GT2 family glycosyltransferase